MDVGSVLPGEAATLRAAQATLEGRRGGIPGLWPFLGPAFIAAVAYIDPGNFATNIAGGAKFGYLLLWVVLSANLMAMLVQTLSAKLGIATGRNLPEMCRDNFRPVRPSVAGSTIDSRPRSQPATASVRRRRASPGDSRGPVGQRSIARI